MKVLIYITFTILFIFSSAFLFSQNKIDSLNNLLNSSNYEESCEILNKIGYYYYNRENYVEAMNSWHKLKEVSGKKGNDLFFAHSVYNLGLIYYNLNEYEKSLSFSFDALDLYEELDNKKGCASSLNVVGLIFMKQNNKEKALLYFNRCFKLCNENNNVLCACGALSNIGLILLSKHKLDSALLNFKTALKLANENDLQEFSGSILNNIGLIYQAKSEDAVALTFFKKAYNIKEETLNKRGMASVLNNIGASYISLLEFDFAKKNLLKASKIAEEINDLEILQNNNLNFAELYAMHKEFEKSLEYRIKYDELKDSIYNEKTDRLINELETKYDLKQKLNEIKIKNIQIKKQRNSIAALFVGLLFVFIFFIGVLFFTIKIKRSNKQLLDRNIEIVATQKEQKEAKKELETIIEKLKIKQTNKTCKKYEQSALDINSKNDISRKISSLFENEKPFLKSDFSINTLAKSIDTSRSYVSEVINDVYKSNFNNFVNKYRIDEARRLMSEPHTKQYTIQYISTQVGFKSISTFNRAFNKYVGLTPSYFLKSIQQL